jgi:two-component system, chemotaxis family, protein-glutamate methylesterase/glutaminase
MMPTAPIRVLIVDDSAVVRQMVSQALSQDSAITVVGTATDPFQARNRILELKPDVITLDIEMPRMDGLTFLEIMMREHPIPAIVMSSLTQKGSDQAMEALRLGAVEVLSKPGGPYSFGQLGPDLIRAVKAAAQARPGVRRPAPAPAAAACRQESPPARQPPAATGGGQDRRKLILLGASTGGTEALREVLCALPPGLPPIAIVQHIPAHFSRAFAMRLNDLCAFPVSEASHGGLIPWSSAVVAPGDYHLCLDWAGQGWRTRLDQGPPVWHQRPAVDVMFRSIPQALLGYTIAGVLTGMGKDGAAGLLRLRQNRAHTFSQDEPTSVVYGMPREAWEQGGSACQLPLDAIADHITRLALYTH